MGLDLPGLSSWLGHFPDPVLIADNRKRIVFLNQAATDLLGCSIDPRGESPPCSDLLRVDMAGEVHCFVDCCLERREHVHGVPVRIQGPQGSWRNLAVTATYVEDRDGNPAGCFAILSEIREDLRPSPEAALARAGLVNGTMTPSREVEKMLELLTEMSQDGILIADEDGRVTRANARMAEITGRAQTELVGLDVGELLPAQHVENMRYLALKLEQEKDQPQQMRFLSTIPGAGAGEQGQGVFDTTMVVSRLGERVVTYLYLHDITERIAIEAELRKANNFLTNIIQSSVDGIVVVDMKGNVLIFNEGAEGILGYTAEEAKRERHIMRRIFSPELARELMRRMRSPEHGPPGKLNPIRLNFTRKDGHEVPVSFSAAIINEGGEEIASVGIFSDRTERVRLQRELEDAQRQVVQAEKIASLGRLAAGVAHEINNPLAGILIYAEALLKEIAERPQWREDLQEIITQTLRCKQIVTRLLEFSRQSLGQRVLFDLNEIIGRCVDLLARQSLFHDVQIVLDLERELPQIVGDPVELQQVGANLMINAADAMLGRGRLDIRTRSMAETEEVILEFADTGPGIAPEVEEKIFEPFFTTKPPGSGTGLGLSVVYGIIQRHNGTIEVTSP
ncbi:MAG: sensor signal transduction histidine kinase, partial [Deltaproteobacteria bacterium]|nr:sensor signal transduction histidine kinase [Deltaproteobacteria bacterium]